ncbi:Hypothetical predicted protein, partial [Paramuricea clavata]
LPQQLEPGRLAAPHRTQDSGPLPGTGSHWDFDSTTRSVTGHAAGKQQPRALSFGGGGGSSTSSSGSGSRSHQTDRLLAQQPTATTKPGAQDNLHGQSDDNQQATVVSSFVR